MFQRLLFVHDPDVDQLIGPAPRRFRVALGANQDPSRRAHVTHHPFERFDLFDVHFSAAAFGVEYDATAAIVFSNRTSTSTSICLDAPLMVPINEALGVTEVNDLAASETVHAAADVARPRGPLLSQRKL